MKRKLQNHLNYYIFKLHVIIFFDLSQVGDVVGFEFNRSVCCRKSVWAEPIA